MKRISDNILLKFTDTHMRFSIYSSAKNLLYILSIIFTLFHKKLAAQETTDSLTYDELFNKKQVLTSAFGGPIIEFTKINNHLLVCPGLSAGALFNRRLFIAGYANALINHMHIKGKEQDVYNLRFEYGGLWFGYLSSPNKRFHWGLSSKIAKGFIAIERDPKIVIKAPQVFLIAPQVDVEINIVRWLRLNLSSGYRVSTNLNINEIDKKYFNGFTSTIGFIFGECGNNYCF